GSAEPGAGKAPRAGSHVELPRQAFRPILLEDLLGRGSVETDTIGIGDYLDGKTVLVTGAGGSIGSQLCREIARYQPARLVMTDRDDSLLHAVQLSVSGQASLESPDLILGDLRTPGFIADLIGGVRPDVVFHAAAIKHLTLAERFPAEAFLTNVVATADLLRACVTADVDRFVNISTDKAADPQSVLGYTKRVTELLTATFGETASSDARYMSVRFGNVLGSRGSALTTFAAQLAAGRPLTITSGEMTRYFMTVHEACQLVLQAAVDGRTGDGLVLDMGSPHNIEQLARRFATLQGFPEPTIVYTGTRPGEKLAETTLATDEPDERPFHPLISRVHIPTLPRDLLLDITQLRTEAVSPGGREQVNDWLHDAVGLVPAATGEGGTTLSRPAWTPLP
ncbi:MAG: polysaccharide biosynthesis protein, partial [Terracoccus sp.]